MAQDYNLRRLRLGLPVTKTQDVCFVPDILVSGTRRHTCLELWNLEHYMQLGIWTMSESTDPNEEQLEQMVLATTRCATSDSYSPQIQRSAQ